MTAHVGMILGGGSIMTAAIPSARSWLWINYQGVTYSFRNQIQCTSWHILQVLDLPR